MRQLWLAPALCLLLSTGTAHADAPKDVAEVYAWFDTLELPDVRKLLHVEVRLAAPRDAEGKPYEAKHYRSVIEGFVTAEDEQSVSLFTYDLYRLTIPRSEIVAAPKGRLYRPLPLATSAERLLARIKLQRKRLDAEKARQVDISKPEFSFSDEELITLGLDHSERFSSAEPASSVYRHDFHPQIDALLMAWLCKQLGADASRQRLEEQVPHLPGAGCMPWNRPTPSTFLQNVASGIAFDFQRRAKRSLALRRTTWQQVQAQCDWIARRFPQDTIFKDDREFLSRVQRVSKTMRPAEECLRLDVEIAAARKSGGPWKAGHAEYLIYSLRNEGGWIDFEPFDTGALADLRLCGDVGLAAMIDHVDNDVPTKWLGTSTGILTADLWCLSTGDLIWADLQQRDLLPLSLAAVGSSDPPEVRAALKAKLRTLLLKPQASTVPSK